MANISNTLYREINGRDLANAIKAAQKDRESLYAAGWKVGTSASAGTSGLAGTQGLPGPRADWSTSSFAGIKQPTIVSRKKVDFNITKL